MADLAERFRAFAEHAPSPLYRTLAAAVGEHEDIHALLARAEPAQQWPMLLFAAVHLEVLRSGGEYPLDGAAFAQFCSDHRTALAATIAARSTQTNEVNRCTYLLPALAAAADGRPLALIEVGASAGLNLNLDRYAYDYGGGVTAGADGSPVRLAAELRGAVPPLELGVVAARTGIDLAPRPDDEWLRACVFADQPVRRARLDAALALARAHPPELITGDAVERLAPTIEAAPAGAQVVVFHTAVAFYLDDAQVARLRELSAGVTYVTAEAAAGHGDFELRVDGRRLGRAHPHGAWLDWEDASL